MIKNYLLLKSKNFLLLDDAPKELPVEFLEPVMGKFYYINVELIYKVKH